MVNFDLPSKGENFSRPKCNFPAVNQNPLKTLKMILHIKSEKVRGKMCCILAMGSHIKKTHPIKFSYQGSRVRKELNELTLDTL